MSQSLFQSGFRSEVQSSLSVSQLNARARSLLEQGLAQVWVEGEVSNFVASAAGHWYFSLKDDRAQISCVLFRGQQLLLQRPLKNGDQLLVQGQVSLYEGRGQFQLLARSVRLSGEGDLLARFEALKQKLMDEGLFAPERKRALPAFPRSIGVITSLQGAALHDLLRVLAHRWPLAEVLVYPALVQGAEAPASLCQALQLAEWHGQAEVLVLARGGGSLEDLQAFNDEQLVRQVAATRLPLVSGVGHETDVTLVDFVADLRAATPSAAAERVTPDQAEWLQRVQLLHGRLQHQFARYLQQCQQHLAYVDQGLQRCLYNWQQQKQQGLQQLVQRLQHQSPERSLLRQIDSLNSLQGRLQAAAPQRFVTQQQKQLSVLQARLQRAAQLQLDRAGTRLQGAAQRLQAISPLQTLARGYALVRDAQGQLIRDAAQVTADDALVVTLARGQIQCQVTQHQGVEG